MVRAGLQKRPGLRGWRAYGAWDLLRKPLGASDTERVGWSASVRESPSQSGLRGRGGISCSAPFGAGLSVFGVAEFQQVILVYLKSRIVKAWLREWNGSLWDARQKPI